MRTQEAVFFPLLFLPLSLHTSISSAHRLRPRPLTERESGSDASGREAGLHVQEALCGRPIKKLVFLFRLLPNEAHVAYSWRYA
jgi:hypothetical protein